ncbi:MAG: hypothetical protein KGQ37_03695 [Hyphomicrobiales bacterium]|nr:hypothetical protein [Hyphomicrobiales bacterium]
MTAHTTSQNIAVQPMTPDMLAAARREAEGRLVAEYAPAVMRMVLRGATASRIAATLEISAATVRRVLVAHDVIDAPVDGARDAPAAPLKRPGVADLLQAAAAAVGVPVASLRGGGAQHDRDLSMRRNFVAWWLVRACGMTQIRVGQLMDRDQQAVCYAVMTMQSAVDRGDCRMWVNALAGHARAWRVGDR